jgi:hypothetical protein
MDTDTDMPSEQ